MADVIFIVISIVLFLISLGMAIWTIIFVLKDHAQNVKELQEHREKLYKAAEQYREDLEQQQAKSSK